MGESRRLFEFNDNPAIVEMRDRDLLGFVRGDTLVLTDLEGHKTHIADVRFSDVLSDLGKFCCTLVASTAVLLPFYSRLI